MSNEEKSKSNPVTHASQNAAYQMHRHSQWVRLLEGVFSGDTLQQEVLRLLTPQSKPEDFAEAMLYVLSAGVQTIARADAKHHATLHAQTLSLIARLADRAFTDPVRTEEVKQIFNLSIAPEIRSILEHFNEQDSALEWQDALADALRRPDFLTLCLRTRLERPLYGLDKLSDHSIMSYAAILSRNPQAVVSRLAGNIITYLRHFTLDIAE